MMIRRLVPAELVVLVAGGLAACLVDVAFNVSAFGYAQPWKAPITQPSPDTTGCGYRSYGDGPFTWICPGDPIVTPPGMPMVRPVAQTH
jgi:hypothetical protein